MDYKPIRYKGKVYTQLKPITGEAIYNAQQDKDCAEFREEFGMYLHFWTFFNDIMPSIHDVAEWLTYRAKWVPFFEQHGFIKIEEEQPELKPCPFCGGKVNLEHDMKTDHYIRCDKCTLSMYRSEECIKGANCGGNTSDLIEAWNRRE